jgi:RimJ/RimL family protein N-acetyltransferase
MARLVGELVVLRPFHLDELDAFLAPRRGFGDGKRPRRDAIRRRLLRSGQLVGGFLDLAIEVEGRLVGDVQARQPPRGLPPGVFEIGFGIYEAADRRRGYGRDAVRLLVGYLFGELGAVRVQASTAVWNDAARGLLAALGFAEEGVMRAFMPVAGGQRDDYVLASLLPGDWARSSSTRPK